MLFNLVDERPYILQATGSMSVDRHQATCPNGSGQSAIGINVDSKGTAEHRGKAVQSRSNMFAEESLLFWIEVHLGRASCSHAHTALIVYASMAQQQTAEPLP
jgi:hypothetical protein